MKKNILLIGSSRGIGAELVEHLRHSGNTVFGVSRSKSFNCEWIQGDISTVKGIEKIVKKLDDLRIDTMIFSAGVWENKGFTQDFDFLDTEDYETRHIMSVNVVAPIEITKRLVRNLSLSDSPKAIYIGAMSGVENLASDQVAYSASKFALRGAIQGLRKSMNKKGIGFTVINLGTVATEEVLLDMENGVINKQKLIPISDIASTIDWLMSVSSNVDVGDINLIQRNG